MLAPLLRGPLSESAAPPGRPRRHPKRQQGVAPPLLERLPMSIRNGTSSSVNPQPPTAASGGRRLSEEEKEVCGWMSK
jgi:hypothetical protein